MEDFEFTKHLEVIANRLQSMKSIRNSRWLSAYLNAEAPYRSPQTVSLILSDGALIDNTQSIERVLSNKKKVSYAEILEMLNHASFTTNGATHESFEVLLKINEAKRSMLPVITSYNLDRNPNTKDIATLVGKDYLPIWNEFTDKLAARMDVSHFKELRNTLHKSKDLRVEILTQMWGIKRRFIPENFPEPEKLMLGKALKRLDNKSKRSKEAPGVAEFDLTDILYYVSELVKSKNPGKYRLLLEDRFAPVKGLPLDGEAPLYEVSMLVGILKKYADDKGNLPFPITPEDANDIIQNEDNSIYCTQCKLLKQLMSKRKNQAQGEARNSPCIAPRLMRKRGIPCTPATCSRSLYRLSCTLASSRINRSPNLHCRAPYYSSPHSA